MEYKHNVRANIQFKTISLIILKYLKDNVDFFEYRLKIIYSKHRLLRTDIPRNVKTYYLDLFLTILMTRNMHVLALLGF